MSKKEDVINNGKADKELMRDLGYALKQFTLMREELKRRMEEEKKEKSLEKSINKDSDHRRSGCDGWN